MLRVSSNALIVPPFECAWLSLDDYQLRCSCCIEFECKGENDVTIILKPVAGAKRWQHLQRQQGPAGGEQLAVEENYTIILGSHCNSKLKLEKNGDEKAFASGLPGCTVDPSSFSPCWINYSNGVITVGRGAAGSCVGLHWQDPEQPIPNIQHIGLSCWDKHVSYRHVQVLPPVPAAAMHPALQLLQRQLEAPQVLANPAACSTLINGDQKQQQQLEHLVALQQQQSAVLPLLQLVMDAIAASTVPAAVCDVLLMSELLLPRSQPLYDAAVQLAGKWLELLVQQHSQELAGLSAKVLADVLQEPLLDVPELVLFQAVAAWCQQGVAAAAARSDGKHSSSCYSFYGNEDSNGSPAAAANTGVDGCAQAVLHSEQPVANGQQQQAQYPLPAILNKCSLQLPQADVLDMLRLVQFGFMTEADRQAVLHHPFTQQCPLVQQCMQEDLQRLQDSTGSLSPKSCYIFEQRRLVRPAAAVAANANLQAASGSGQHQPDGQASQHAQNASGHIGLGATSNGSNHASRSSPKCGWKASMAAAANCTVNKPGSLAAHTLLRQASAGPVGTAVSNSTISTASLSRSSSGPLGSSRTIAHGRPLRRLPHACTELMYVCDGDRNGVIYHIATDHGNKQWVNPVLSKALEIKASSPPSRYTDAKAIVSGQFLNTSFAGPRYARTPHLPAAEAHASGTAAGSTADGSLNFTPSTWWRLDLGPQHRLLCNYYTIRHDGSQDGFVRNWVLQGSNDLHHWLDLRRHSNDATMRLPGQYGSWPVGGPAASMPFRAFRLLLLGATDSPTNPWAFCLGYWELYGYFYNLTADEGVKFIAQG